MLARYSAEANGKGVLPGCLYEHQGRTVDAGAGRAQPHSRWLEVHEGAPEAWNAANGEDVVPYDEPLARLAGELLAATGLSDPVDAGVALLAHRQGGIVVTSDAKDLALLTGAP